MYSTFPTLHNFKHYIPFYQKYLQNGHYNAISCLLLLDAIVIIKNVTELRLQNALDILDNDSDVNEDFDGFSDAASDEDEPDN